MPLYEIKHQSAGAILFSLECESFKACVEAGIKTCADLTDASLRGAALRGAVLTCAALRGADLTDADLTDASLRGASLRGAVLTGADLTGADLTRADLRGAVLTGADLTGADLTRADLTRADLRGADLTRADLSVVRDDLWAVLSSSPAEVAGLLAALQLGMVNGSSYSGECACLIGTLAKVRHCDFREIPGLTPNPDRPAERWFLGIKQGHTPENAPICAQTVVWVEDWLARMRAAFATHMEIDNV